ncbi:retrovirus-related pol polyprotein from transposon TNT 1-94 [Tanacetum coccineum]|uniref:Retrovirus-related pol polyprotein from transposon TNT 1-94 n=1 Tax=Tanacetum coccineum TaxID=301880 RepID=A0ABQ4YWK1_9ASTR
MSPENKEHYQSEKEAIHLLLTGIGDEIYSTVNACKTAYDMWITIERIQHGESLNIQDVKTNLFWEFGRFTSHDGESISNASTNYKGKEIAKPITPPSELASEEDNDSEQAQRDKDMQKNLVLIAKYFKKIYEPTNNNLRTSSNPRNKNVDTSPRYKNDIQTGQFGNHRVMTVAEARETVGSQETKKVKDYTYHKEKMLMCKQAEIDSGTDTEPLEKVQYDAEYNVFANARQHSEQPESINNTCVVEKVDKCDGERAAFANLIENITLDTEENKYILKKLKKSNASLTQALKDCKFNLEESNTARESCLIALQCKQTELETYKTLNDRTIDYDKLERKLNETLGLLAQKEIDIKECLKLKAYENSVKRNTMRNQSIQTTHMLAPKGSTFNGRPTFANPMYLKNAQYEKPCLYEIPYDPSDLANRFIPDREETLTLEQDSQANKSVATPMKTVASESTIQKSKSYYRMLYEQIVQLFYLIVDLDDKAYDRQLKLLYLQGNDLLTGNRAFDLYTISLQETTSSTPIFFMAKASPTQAWLWHRRLSHLNFDYINLISKKDIVIGLPKLTYVKDQLCSSSEVSKAKRSSFKTKVVPSSKGRLDLLHMDLCGPMRVESINGKKYILVIVDDYSRYTWTLFLRSKDETPEVLKYFLKMNQRNLQAQVIIVRTDRGTKFLNQTLHVYFKEEVIKHQTSTPRTPEQNEVVERQNRTLVEAARTMLSASKLPLFFWVEAIANSCYY